MAFPKTQSGADLMLEAPSPPDAAQYEELGLRFVGAPRRAEPADRGLTTDDSAAATIETRVLGPADADALARGDGPRGPAGDMLGVVRPRTACSS